MPFGRSVGSSSRCASGDLTGPAFTRPEVTLPDRLRAGVARGLLSVVEQCRLSVVGEGAFRRGGDLVGARGDLGQELLDGCLGGVRLGLLLQSRCVEPVGDTLGLLCTFDHGRLVLGDLLEHEVLSQHGVGLAEAGQQEHQVGVHGGALGVEQTDVRRQVVGLAVGKRLRAIRGGKSVDFGCPGGVQVEPGLLEVQRGADEVGLELGCLHLELRESHLLDLVGALVGVLRRVPRRVVGVGRGHARLWARARSRAQTCPRKDQGCVSTRRDSH